MTEAAERIRQSHYGNVIHMESVWQTTSALRKRDEARLFLNNHCQKNPKNLSVLTSFPEEPLKERNSFSKNTQSGLDVSVEFPLTL